MNLQKKILDVYFAKLAAPQKSVALGGCLVCLMDEPGLIGTIKM